MIENYPKAYLYRRTVLAKLFIDRYFAEPIDVNNIADEALVSKYHFIRQFKKIYGQTPMQYLTRVRIERSMQLLSQGLSVSQTCHEVGYDSPTSFAGLFRRMVGVTPSSYGHQQRDIQEKTEKRPLSFVPGCFAAKKGWTKKSNFEEGSL